MRLPISIPGLLLAPAVLAPLLALGFAAAAAADEAALRRDVEYLASDALEGRLTGSPGARAAAAHLAAELAALGAQPLPGQDGFELPFEFTAGTDDRGSTVGLGDGRSWTGTEQVLALSFSESATVAGEVVFAGYGLQVPESQDFPYDSYAGLEVDGKIVLVLRYFPEDVDPQTRALLARYSGLRYKARAAREHGATAMLVVTGPRSPNAGSTIPMAFDTAVAGSDIVAASISGEVAAALFAGLPDGDLEAAQKALDDGNPHVAGFTLPGVEVTLTTAVERQRRQGYNVAGYLPGSAAGLDKPWVVLGAHYDHLGRGGGGNSLAGQDEQNAIHHGADDNASGTAAVLEAARRLAAEPPRRSVAIAFWSGEELGLLGANAFIEQQVLPAEELAAYVNLDMVGRPRDNKLTLQAAGSSSLWPGLVERSNVPVGFDLTLNDDPYLPTDSAAFNLASVPTLNLFSGSHEDYHRPSDTADKIDYPGLDRVAAFAGLIARRVADLDLPPDFVKVEPQRRDGGDRDSVRAFTGTIPDYATEVEGLRLSGVIAGGPAAEAGLQAGDVIVELAGQAIANIYDYTYALDAVKIGVPAQVVVLRDGERRELTITPRARN